MNEIELIQKCKKNEYAAQMQVYHLYKHHMYNSSYRIVRNREDAEDIVQESFIKAFEKIHQVKDDLKLGGWLRRIVVNASLDVVRKKKHQLEWNDLRIVEEEVEEEIDDCSDISIDFIKESIYHLKEKYQIILILYLIEDYTHKEISELLQLKESTVRNQYRRGKQQLVGRLKQYKNDEFRKLYKE